MVLYFLEIYKCNCFFKNVFGRGNFCLGYVMIMIFFEMEKFLNDIKRESFKGN